MMNITKEHEKKETQKVVIEHVFYIYLWNKKGDKKYSN